MSMGEKTSIPADSPTMHLPTPAGEEKDMSSQVSSDDHGSITHHEPEKVPTHHDDDDRAEELTRIATADYPTAYKLAMIVVALVLSIFLVALDMTIVATAIPKITDEFHSLDQVGWYGSAFFLTLGSFQSTWGKAYKFFPLKASFLGAIAIFELGSLICAVAPNSTALIVGRAIAGAFPNDGPEFKKLTSCRRGWSWHCFRGLHNHRLCGAAETASSIHRHSGSNVWSRECHRSSLGWSVHVQSHMAMVVSGSYILLDVVENADIASFYVNLPVGGASALVILLFFQTPAASKPVKASWREKLLQMDPLGTFTIMGAIVCYLLALQWGGTTKPWSSGSVIGTLVAFCLLLILFGVVEWWMGDRAILQGELFLRRAVFINCLYIFL